MDKKATHKWLMDRKLRSQTEGMLLAAQDRVIQTRVYQVKIMGDPGELFCRACGEREETIGHILSSCPEYYWTLYKEGHDSVLYQLVRLVARKLSICQTGCRSKRDGKRG